MWSKAKEWGWKTGSREADGGRVKGGVERLGGGGRAEAEAGGLRLRGGRHKLEASCLTSPHHLPPCSSEGGMN